MKRVGVVLLLAMSLGVVAAFLDSTCFDLRPGGTCPDGCAHCSPLGASCCQVSIVLPSASSRPGVTSVIATSTDSEPRTPEPLSIEIWHVPLGAA